MERWFGVSLSEYRLIKSGKKRLRLTTPEALEFGVKDVVRGVYLAKKAPYGYIISIEGSYLIGRCAERHVVELAFDQFRIWMRGEDLEVDLPERGIYLIRHGRAFAGSGYYNGKILQNLIPKSRTVEP